MIEGRIFALTMAVQHLLRKLESKGVLSYAETQALLDGVLEEIDQLEDGVISGRGNAHNTIGMLYLPKRG
jgi:hypothetical protein